MCYSLVQCLIYISFLFDTAGFLTTGRTAPTTETRFGVIVNPASVPTHLDEVLCTGDERGIIDCIHSGVGVEDCGHSEDVGIGCSKCNSRELSVCGILI